MSDKARNNPEYAWKKREKAEKRKRAVKSSRRAGRAKATASGRHDWRQA